MSDTLHDDPDVVRSTRRWQKAGTFVLFLLVLAFPLYRATDGSRRDMALESRNQALMSQGHELWRLNCASCHGITGQGGSAPALNSQEFLTSVNDDQINGIIAGGIPGTAMPVWLNDYGGPLTDEQIAALVTYFRSWQKDAPSVPNWRTPTP
ncbi:MAG: c-type cytochrome [Actinomycetota bacterium]|nr:c-type cytochrome [Actinomycetota bacterium]